MFAKDGVGIVGGVSAIGDGTPNSKNGPIYSIDVEPSMLPLALSNLIVSGNFRPKLQVETKRYPFERANEKAPGLANFFGNAFLHIAGFLANTGPEKTRKNNIPTQFERATFLTGLPAPTQTAWEEANTMGLDFGPQISSSVDFQGSEPVLNLPDCPPDSLTDQVQGPMTNEHDMLMPFKLSFPNVPVQQAEVVARTVVLGKVSAAGNFVGELNIPDGTVACRVTWTGMRSGNDLWVSFQSGAVIPTGANQTGGAVSGIPPQADPGTDGMILNPDDTKKYLVKNKRAISFVAQAATTVNIQCYQQA